MLASISMAYAGFDGNLANWAGKWLSLIIGMIIIYSFASSRYNVPTFAKTSLGPIGQLSPKSLAPDSRYQTGFLIYLSLLMLLYFAFCIIGPKVLDVPGISIPENWKDSTLWPVGAASVLVTVGLAADNRFPGNIENFFRRKAHEAAYIPTAFATLSQQIAAFRLAEWWSKTQEDSKSPASIRAMTGAEDDDSISRVVQLREGNMVSWIRGNALLHCLGQLSGEQYGAIKAQDENMDAAKLLAVLHESIKTRVGTWSDPAKVKIDAALAKDIESFIDGASVLLASTLLQATPDARELSAAIKGFGFAEIDSTGPQSWAQFATLTLGLICAAAFVVWIVAFSFSDSKWAKVDEISNYSTRISGTATSTAIVYCVAFLVLMYVRERRMNRKHWDERLGSHVDIILWGGVPAALAATGAMLFTSYIENLQGVLSVFAFNLAVALIASIFFVIHMRGAARTKQGIKHVAKRLFGWGTLIHTGTAVTIAVILTFVSMKFNYEYFPGWSMAATRVQFNAVMDELKRRSIPVNTVQNGDGVKPPVAQPKTDKENTATSPAMSANPPISQRAERIYWKLESEFGKLSSMLQSFDGRKPRATKQGESAAADPEAQALTAVAKNQAGDAAPQGGGQGLEAASADAVANAPRQSREIAATGKLNASGPAVINQITTVCASLRELPASSNLFHRDCYPVESSTQETDALPKAIIAFGNGLETLRGDVNNLLEFRDHGDAYDSVLVQVVIAGCFALFVSLAFGVAVRFGRIAQLRNDIDRFDEGIIDDLKQKAGRHFKEAGKSVDIEAWLAEPNYSIGLMTPLEGVRYRGYRASLFDSVRPKSTDARTKESNPASTPVDARAHEQDPPPTPDETHTTTVEAPATVPDVSAAADSEADIVPISAARRSLPAAE
jgi:hypothetical protein